jgi:hypothetical protein
MPTKPEVEETGNDRSHRDIGLYDVRRTADQREPDRADADEVAGPYLDAYCRVSSASRWRRVPLRLVSLLYQKGRDSRI